MKQFCILKMPKSYCVSLIMVAMTTYVLINIFHKVHFLPVKFVMVYEKKYEFPGESNISKSLEKKLKKNAWCKRLNLWRCGNEITFNLSVDKDKPHNSHIQCIAMIHVYHKLKYRVGKMFISHKAGQYFHNLCILISALMYKKTKFLFKFQNFHPNTNIPKISLPYHRFW